MKEEYKAQAKYDAANTKQIRMKLNLKTDKDVLDWLNKQRSMQGAIKKLIREEIVKEETMAKMDMSKLDIRNLGEKAQRFFEESDQGATQDIFGECKTIEEINAVAEELYDEFFAD